VWVADLTGLSYRGYRADTESGFAAGLPGLNRRLDLDADGDPDNYLVYEPYQDQGNDAVQTETWQTWDAYRGGAALWWGNGPVAAEGCGQATPCTLPVLLDLFRDATIREDPATDGFRGSLSLNAGSYNPDQVGAVDRLSVGVGDETTTFDFGSRPLGKADCKKGGWETNFNDYRDQGDCVSHFASAGKKRH